MELKDMTFPQVLQLEIFQEELDQQMQRETNVADDMQCWFHKIGKLYFIFVFDGKDK